ncbi:hypothetical protein [Actinokineospora sp. HUAS TT18]|uniref:hypothetical protein n=1 Tax=Actinokineospora sp. HUAS TT18 TaxID=3447451 RepID=UPI003F5207EA
MPVPVDPLYVAFSRAQVTNADEVTAALTAGEQIVPVDLGPAQLDRVGAHDPLPDPEPDESETH